MGRFRSLTLIALLALAGCTSNPTPAPASISTPSSALWKLTPGSWTEYQILRGTATFDPASGLITVDSASLIPGEIDRITCLPYTTPEGPAIARVYSAQGVTVTAVPAGLVGVLVESNNGQFIGESANVGATDQNPPEPLLTDNPVAGETFTTVSTITWASGAKPAPFVTQYWTRAVGVTVDGFTNATVTGLLENPGKAGQMSVYAQVFDGGADMAEQWAGQVRADNTVDVIMARRVATGVNP